MFRFLILFVCVVFLVPVMGLVDTKSGNYKKTFTDFEIGGGAFSLSLNRTYNSRSLYKGLFGVGWCSNLETRVDVLPDNTIKLTECGGGQEVIFISKTAKTDVDKQVNQILVSVNNQNKSLSRDYFQKLKQKLLASHVLRSEFLRAYNVKGKILDTPYIAEGRSNEILIYDKRGFFRRVLPSGVDQYFNAKEGQMIQVSDRSGNYIKIEWKKRNNKSVPHQFLNQRGQKISFTYSQQGMRVTSGGNLLAQYVIEGENLVRVQNKDGVHVHKYDELHNIKETQYPQIGSSQAGIEKLTYNTKKDWVTSFENKRKCKETYGYKVNPKNSNHYWTDVKKQCGKIVTNVSRYEFWNRKRQDGTSYLHRARQDVNGEVTDVTYHPQFKRAVSHTKNGQRVNYEYSNNGLMKVKATTRENVLFSKYDRKCRKPKTVAVQRLSSEKKVSSQITVSVDYNQNTCLMEKASRSDGKWVEVNHDTQGRIQKMKDQSGKTIVVRYLNDQSHSPRKITHEGVGSIEMNFDSKGNPRGWKPDSDPVVMTHVLSVFNGLVEIINPVREAGII